MADSVAEALVGDSGRAVARAREIRLGERFGQEFPPGAGRPILDAVLSHELAIISLWDYAFDRSEDRREEKRKFHQLCGDCLDLLKALPEPQDRAERMLHRLKLVSYAYLGERWEEAQEIAGSAPELSDNWRDRVFESIFSSLLLLARKELPADIKEAAGAMGRLRQEQKSMEGPYLDGVDAEHRRGAAHELASLYHLAKCAETAAGYMESGLPRDVRAVLDMLFDKAFYHCRRSGQKDLEVVERMLKLVLKKMAENSVWAIASGTMRVKELVDASASSGRPVFELLYPQRTAILDGGLLDPASQAAIVSMPMSSGKTLMAELRIIQALRQRAESWVAYVAPTRALVNQVAGRLRRRLRPLGIRVEKMSGAIDLDGFEQSMVGSGGFDVLVMTPEKTSMLIRRKKELAESLSLAVIDEAHNLSDPGRGLNLEMLLATIKSDCDADLLLLTPFLSKGEKIAEWLNPEAPKIIKADLGWRSGDSVAGLFYPKGKGAEFSTFFRPLAHFPSVGSGGSAPRRKEFEIGAAPSGYTLGRAKKKYVNASIAAARLAEKGSVLVISRTVPDTWKTAGELAKIMPEIGHDRRLSLVKKFAAAELGDGFPLAGYLDRGIGVHNAGLPDDVRQLVEWLMEEKLLKVLVSTTTTAQGVDFPVSAVLLASYFHPRSAAQRDTRMRPHEFRNIAGRAGRVGQRGIGLVGIATDGSAEEEKKATEFLAEESSEAASVMEELVGQAAGRGGLDLHALATDPRWSAFAQYAAHMYNQAGNLRDYASRIERSLRNTYGYHRMGEEAKGALVRAADEYGRRLDGRREFARMSDVTGFSPETMEDAARRAKAAGITEKDWSGPGLFSGSRLASLMEEMAEMPETRLAGVVASKAPGRGALGRIVSDWVSGSSIPEISRAHFGGAGVEHIPICVQAIYGKISQYAAWSLSAVRQACGAEGGANLPAMVYYGVNTDGAVLMRMNSVPRGVSVAMGGAYAAEHDVRGSKPSEVREWLDDLGGSGWDAAARGARMSGSEYKLVWRRLAGLD